MTSDAYILYIDYQGHPAPLTECYHATASRRLSSAVHRSPPATSVEVDSAYCPQCLSFHDLASAALLGVCRKATCAKCPLCLSVASVTASDNQCFYQCGRCEWSSKECNLVIPVEMTDGVVDRLELARAAEDLVTALHRRQDESSLQLEAHFKNLSEYWGAKGSDDRDRMVPQRHRKSSSATSTWSIQALEESIATKQQKLGATVPDVLGSLEVKRISLDAAQVQSTNESLLNIPLSSLDLQTIPGVTSRSDLLPLPIQLRARLSRRCRAEIAEGRPGILLKPKLNPLEGDSSLRSGHGQWWKKDSSAIHVMPNVTVVQKVKTENGLSLLLKVTNPTLGSVRLRFAPSSYPGEPDFDNDSQTTTHLADLLVDTLSQKRVSANVTHLLNDFEPTNTVELLSAEDSIIEMGGRAHEIPDEVRSWQPSSSVFSVVAQKASSAWLGVNLPVQDVESPVAVPFAMQIEVGNGSWDSALIQSQATEEQADRATFDLVVILQ